MCKIWDVSMQRSHSAFFFKLVCLVIYCQHSCWPICCRAAIAVATARPQHRRLLRLKQERLQVAERRATHWFTEGGEKNNFWLEREKKQEFLPHPPISLGWRGSDEHPPWEGGGEGPLRAAEVCLRNTKSRSRCLEGPRAAGEAGRRTSPGGSRWWSGNSRVVQPVVRGGETDSRFLPSLQVLLTGMGQNRGCQRTHLPAFILRILTAKAPKFSTCVCWF